MAKQNVVLWKYRGEKEETENFEAGTKFVVRYKRLPSRIADECAKNETASPTQFYTYKLVSFLAPSRSPRNANLRSFVCSFDENLYRALNLHLSLSGQS